MLRDNTLSETQRAILHWCLRRLVALALQGTGQMRRDLLTRGVPWPVTHRSTPARRASLSRTLRRLEVRGLVVRSSVRGRGRTTHIRLTPAGIALAKRLTAQADAADG